MKKFVGLALSGLLLAAIFTFMSCSAAPSTQAEQTPDLYSGFIILRLSPAAFGQLATQTDDLHVLAKEAGATALLHALNECPRCAASRVVTSIRPQEILESEQKATARGYPPRHSLTLYWRLDARSIADPERLVGLLSQATGVERAYRELAVSDAAAVNPSNDPYASQQLHLNSAPTGIGARWAWTQPNGSGATIGFVDLEQGWLLPHDGLPGHEDLPPIVVPLSVVSPLVPQQVNPTSVPHGTAVLGIVVGVDNDKGIIGIAPTAAWVSVASYFQSTVVEAINALKSHMAPGDVLVMPTVLNNNLPLESDEAIFDAIQQATDQGIIVVEAAGNFNLSLDTLALNRGNRATDSGAIIVGASKSTLDATMTAHDRWFLQLTPTVAAGSNFGSRVDCYAFGENVVTTGPAATPAAALGPGTGPTNQYRKDFGGTSAAAPIVAGAALVLQGMYKAAKGVPLTPVEMRSALCSPGTGTPQGTSGTVNSGKPIGVMPDLQKAATLLYLATSAPPAPTDLRSSP